MKTDCYPTIKLSRNLLDRAIKRYICDLGIAGCSDIHDLGKIRFVTRRARAGVSKIVGVKVSHA